MCGYTNLFIHCLFLYLFMKLVAPMSQIMSHEVENCDCSISFAMLGMCMEINLFVASRYMYCLFLYHMNTDSFNKFVFSHWSYTMVCLAICLRMSRPCARCLKALGHSPLTLWIGTFLRSLCNMFVFFSYHFQ